MAARQIPMIKKGNLGIVYLGISVGIEEEICYENGPEDSYFPGREGYPEQQRQPGRPCIPFPRHSKTSPTGHPAHHGASIR
jgi:hypothetical protein